MTEQTGWQPISNHPPVGSKVAIVCNDGCSSSLGLVAEYGILDGEDGLELTVQFLQGAIWSRLPDDYPLRFMERHDDY